MHINPMKYSFLFYLKYYTYKRYDTSSMKLKFTSKKTGLKNHEPVLSI